MMVLSNLIGYLYLVNLVVNLVSCIIFRIIKFYHVWQVTQDQFFQKYFVEVNFVSTIIIFGKICSSLWKCDITWEFAVTLLTCYHSDRQTSTKHPWLPDHSVPELYWPATIKHLCLKSRELYIWRLYFIPTIKKLKTNVTLLG